MDKDFFHQELKKIADPQRAQNEKRYLKSPYVFYGVRIPELRKIVRTYYRQHPQATKKDWLKLALSCWQDDNHNLKTVAVEILRIINQKLSPADLPLLEKLLSESVNWDHVDEISVHLVGPILAGYPETKKILKVWNGHPLFWLRRASLLPQLYLMREGKEDLPLLIQNIKALLNEDHWFNSPEDQKRLSLTPLAMQKFFIRKSIGWVLRELSRFKPLETVNIVNQFKSQLSGLSYRQATRNLPDKYKKILKQLPFEL
jgi:3-methyladenine DNA glycosylase AlkD